MVFPFRYLTIRFPYIANIADFPLFPNTTVQGQACRLIASLLLLLCQESEGKIWLIKTQVGQISDLFIFTFLWLKWNIFRFVIWSTLIYERLQNIAQATWIIHQTWLVISLLFSLHHDGLFAKLCCRSRQNINKDCNINWLAIYINSINNKAFKDQVIYRITHIRRIFWGRKSGCK